MPVHGQALVLYFRNVANHLPESRRTAMWAAYQEQQSASHAAKKCRVHPRTAERYRQLDRWDERIEKIRAEAQEQADVTLASAMAESLVMVRDYKKRIAAALQAKEVRPADVTVSELERLIRLEAFVLGGVESRHAVTGDFATWSDEQLEAFARDGTYPTSQSRGPS